MFLSRKEAGILCGVLMGYGTAVSAAEWQLLGALTQSMLYNDNISLGLGRRTPVFGYVLMPSMEARRATRALDIRLDGYGDIRRFDESTWDCDNYGVRTDGRYRLRRNIFALRAGYSQSCSYVQQIEDTGILVPSSRYENFTFGPSWKWRWTKRSNIIAEAGYSKVMFSTNDKATILPFSFSGNENVSALLGADYAWSRKLSLNGAFQFNNIRFTEANTSEQNLYGLQVGANYTIDKRWDMSVGAGFRAVEATLNQGGPGTTQSTIGHVGNISLRYHGHRDRFSIGYSNSIVPSAFGDTRQYHAAVTEYSHEIVRRLFLNLGATFSRSEPLNQGFATTSGIQNVTRDFYSGSASLAWEFARYWELRAGYLYRRQDYQGGIGSGDSNLVMLTVSYAWPGIRASR